MCYSVQERARLAPSFGKVVVKKASLLTLPNLQQLKKRSRARVTIEGQCVLLKNSFRIKIADFFSIAKITVGITSF